MKVKGCGNLQARIMLVGEAPGAEEERLGQPFVGPAGQTLRKGLASVGIDIDAVWLTNLSMERPPQNKLRAWFTNDGKPAHIAIFEGLMNLQQEIERVHPNVIVACGNFPLAMLTGLATWKKVKDKTGNSMLTYAGISDWRGSIVESKLLPGFKVIPTYHPSYIMREGMSDHGIWLVDLERIRRESDFPEIRIPKKERIIDPRGSDWWPLKDKLLAGPVTTVDIEYVGSNLLCVGMTNSRDWAVTLKTDSASQIQEVRDVLTSGVGLNAQNAVYDMSILEWWYNIPAIEHIVYDTLLAAHAANPELPKALDFLASVYTDQRYYKNMINWKAVKEGRQSIMEVLDYNTIDVWVQHEVMEEQLKWDMDDPATVRTFRFELLLLKSLWAMSKRGVKVKKDEIEKLREELEDDIRIRTEVLWMATGKHINVKSGPDIRFVLYDFLGLKPTRTTKTGPATDDKTVAEVKLQTDDPFKHKVIELVRKIRKNRDLISKFLDIQFDTDGRMRGHYDPAGTQTGRLASRKFYPTETGGNQQNIPTDSQIRSMFVPDPPKLFVYADLERAESLVVAQLTQDPEMLRVHSKGIDAHRELAARIFRKPLEEITADERYIGKRTRHAGNYMLGPRTFMIQVNKDANKTGVAITYAQARDYIALYRETHPFLERWWADVERQLWKNRTLENLLGRKRVFYGHIRSVIPTAVAYNPQSTVGDTLNVALLNLDGVGCDYMRELELWPQYEEWSRELHEYGYEPLLQVHDAVGFQIEERHIDRALSLVERLMTVPLTVPKTLAVFCIPVEIKYGPSWGELELWRRGSHEVDKGDMRAQVGSLQEGQARLG